ncbi:MAG: rRNA adenine N-6-methyltransferase family protein [Balneolales bacterium]
MPSSRYLARDAVRMVVERLEKPGREPISILEVGAGTGIFTEHIVSALGKQDRFDVVELNNYFCNILKHRFTSSSTCKIYHQDILTFQPACKYDFVLSSLPYERIPTSVTRKLWEHKLSLCKPDSFIIYYKYLNFNHFRSRFEKQLVRSNLFDEKVVFLNIPPARLMTLRIDDPVELCSRYNDKHQEVDGFRDKYVEAENVHNHHD